MTDKSWSIRVDHNKGTLFGETRMREMGINTLDESTSSLVRLGVPFMAEVEAHYVPSPSIKVFEVDDNGDISQPFPEYVRYYDIGYKTLHEAVIKCLGDAYNLHFSMPLVIKNPDMALPYLRGFERSAGEELRVSWISTKTG